MACLETAARPLLCGYANLFVQDDRFGKSHRYRLFSFLCSNMRHIQSSVKSAAAPYLVTSAFYETHDPEIVDAASAEEIHGSVLAVFKDGSARPTARLDLPASSEQITSFILAQRHPTVFELDASNFDEIMHSSMRPLVVLVALKKNGRPAAELEKEVEELRKIAKAWYKGGRHFQQPVWFAWIDGERYKKFLKQNYGYATASAEPSFCNR
jgi:hypothetical protein